MNTYEVFSVEVGGFYDKEGHPLNGFELITRRYIVRATPLLGNDDVAYRVSLADSGLAFIPRSQGADFIAWMWRNRK